MKALIISDDQNIIDSVNSYFNSKNFDTIIYRWLLKAMDNIEEISPELVFVSSQEYPRHWKTLAQFVKSGIGASDTKIILYQNEKMNEEDEKKAQELGISGIINSVDEYGLKSLTLLLEKEKLIHPEISDTSTESEEMITVESLLNEKFDDNEPSSNDSYVEQSESKIEEPMKEETIDAPFVLPEDASLIFTNPVTKTIVTCKIKAYKNKKCTLTVDNPSLVENLTPDNLITEMTVLMDKSVKDYQGFMISNDDNLVLEMESTDEE